METSKVLDTYSKDNGFHIRLDFLQVNTTTYIFCTIVSAVYFRVLYLNKYN